jgi:hypothetical protein
MAAEESLSAGSLCDPTALLLELVLLVRKTVIVLPHSSVVRIWQADDLAHPVL